MVDRSNAALGTCIAHHSIQIKPTVADPPIHELRDPKNIEVTMKRGHLASRNQQQVIKKWLQLAQLIILRLGVVVGDGDEIQTTRSRCLHREKEGARHPAAALALAVAIAMCSMHVQVATIPARANREWLRGEARIFRACVKAYFCPVV